MISGKERARLRGLANGIETTVQIGKNGLTDEVLMQLNETITARELIKVRVLETAMLSPREAAQEAAGALEAEIVQVIGTKFVLYKKNPEKKREKSR